jgi:hypothetical protein
VPDLVHDTIAELRRYGIRLGPGLTDAEVASVEAEFDFTFLAVHRGLLQVALPWGSNHWMDWRNPDRDEVRSRMETPVERIVLEAELGEFWPRSWGLRPTDPEEAATTARAKMNDVPKLVPIYSHRSLPASPAPAESPVFSAYGSDVVYYGANLLDYVFREFDPYSGIVVNTLEYCPVPFWSDLANGMDDTEI